MNVEAKINVTQRRRGEDGRVISTEVFGEIIHIGDFKRRIPDTLRAEITFPQKTKKRTTVISLHERSATLYDEEQDRSFCMAIAYAFKQPGTISWNLSETKDTYNSTIDVDSKDWAVATVVRVDYDKDGEEIISFFDDMNIYAVYTDDEITSTLQEKLKELSEGKQPGSRIDFPDFDTNSPWHLDIENGKRIAVVRNLVNPQIPAPPPDANVEVVVVVAAEPVEPAAPAAPAPTAPVVRNKFTEIPKARAKSSEVRWSYNEDIQKISAENKNIIVSNNQHCSIISFEQEKPKEYNLGMTTLKNLGGGIQAIHLYDRPSLSDKKKHIKSIVSYALVAGKNNVVQRFHIKSKSQADGKGSFFPSADHFSLESETIRRGKEEYAGGIPTVAKKRGPLSGDMRIVDLASVVFPGGVVEAFVVITKNSVLVYVYNTSVIEQGEESPKTQVVFNPHFMIDNISKACVTGETLYVIKNNMLLTFNIPRRLPLRTFTLPFNEKSVKKIVSNLLHVSFMLKKQAGSPYHTVSSYGIVNEQLVLHNTEQNVKLLASSPDNTAIIKVVGMTFSLLLLRNDQFVPYSATEILLSNPLAMALTKKDNSFYAYVVDGTAVRIIDLEPTVRMEASTLNTVTTDRTVIQVHYDAEKKQFVKTPNVQEINADQKFEIQLHNSAMGKVRANKEILGPSKKFSVGKSVKPGQTIAFTDLDGKVAFSFLVK